MAPKQITPVTKIPTVAKTAAPSTKPAATPTTRTAPAAKPKPPPPTTNAAKSATPNNKLAAPPPSPAALRPHLLRAQNDALAMAIEFNKAWIADLQATISTSKSGLSVAEEKKRYENASRELDELMAIVRSVGGDSVGGLGVREVMRLLGRLGKVRGRLDKLEGGVMGWEI